MCCIHFEFQMGTHSWRPEGCPKPPGLEKGYRPPGACIMEAGFKGGNWNFEDNICGNIF